MKKKILFIFLVITVGINIILNYGNASFISNNFTEIKGNTTFNKVHGGGRSLFLYEDYVINPFSNYIITENKIICSGNNSCFSICGRFSCNFTSSYTVDGNVFSTSHFLFKSKNSIRQNWQTINGISSKIVYLEDTYTRIAGIYRPNQLVTVRKYYRINFFYDMTPPTCGDLKLYDNKNLTGAFTYNGGWLNSTKYYTMICSDPETGCKCEADNSSCEKIGANIRTPALPLGHKVIPTANFKNNVNLSNFNCKGNLPNGINEILYDQKSPKINIYLSGSIDFKSENEDNRKYLTGNGSGKVFYEIKDILKIKAGTKNIKFNISDEYLNNSLHGTSGLKSVSILVYRVKGKSNNIIPEVKLTDTGCYFSKNYTEYNVVGNIMSTDNRGKNINLECSEFQKNGRYKVIAQSKDWAGNETKVISYFDVYPNDLSLLKSSITSDSFGDKYANNSDYYTYTLKLRDKYNNPIYNKKIFNFKQHCFEITGCEELTTNEINNSGNKVLKEFGYNGVKSNFNGEINIKIKSLSPGSFSEYFQFSINKWKNNYDNLIHIQNLSIGNVNKNSFKKPIIINDFNTESGNKPKIGVLEKYLIKLNNPGNINISDGKIFNLYSTQIKNGELGHYWNKFNTINGYIGGDINKNLIFSGLLDATSNVLKAPSLKISGLKISYKIEGKNIQYILNNSNELTLGNSCNIETLGVKVYGILEGNGKIGLTGQKSNISDLYKSGIRSKIRKNAYQSIKNRSPSESKKINGVIYVEGDVSYSVVKSNLNDNDTLVIKDGNFIIDEDINKFIGVIVLKNNFVTSSDYNDKGNIYVNNNVSNIKGVFYADGALRSAYANGNNYSDSNLTNRLTLNGSLFTRNTIGGAVLGDSNYTLPGGKITTNYNLASIYDLNYIRKVPMICDGSLDDGYSFIIKYSSSIQTNPPKLFSK